MRVLPTAILLAAACLAVPHAWNNGQTGNTTTTTKAECSDPPYATHDWIADHALDLLPWAGLQVSLPASMPRRPLCSRGISS